MMRWRWWLCGHSGQGYYQDLPGGYLNTDNTHSIPLTLQTVSCLGGSGAHHVAQLLTSLGLISLFVLRKSFVISDS